MQHRAPQLCRLWRPEDARIWFGYASRGSGYFIDLFQAIRVSLQKLDSFDCPDIKPLQATPVKQGRKSVLGGQTTVYASGLGPRRRTRRRLSEHFEHAAYFAFVRVDRAAGSVIKQRILPNAPRLPRLSLPAERSDIVLEDSCADKLGATYLDSWRNLHARPAPWRPKVDEDEDRCEGPMNFSSVDVVARSKLGGLSAQLTCLRCESGARPVRRGGRQSRTPRHRRSGKFRGRGPRRRRPRRSRPRQADDFPAHVH
jgi:hypothetical protein